MLRVNLMSGSHRRAAGIGFLFTVQANQQNKNYLLKVQLNVKHDCKKKNNNNRPQCHHQQGVE